ncbi:MAG: DUF3390 domain-containing protein, partial [Helicobacter sp.]|nr:DUF3390 domain-containing protein [Helicobacter sp.]
LAELIRDLRSERVGQGRKTIVGNDGSTQNPSEITQMKRFASAATSPVKWRAGVSLVGKVGFLGQYVAPYLPVVRHWVRYREFPTIQGGLHAKVAKMQGVIYE